MKYDIIKRSRPMVGGKVYFSCDNVILNSMHAICSDSKYIYPTTYSLANFYPYRPIQNQHLIVKAGGF